MKVLVTGGSGFLGINLIRFLRAKGVEEIRVLDIADFDYPEKGEPYGKATKAYAEWIAAQTREIVSPRDFGFIVKLQKSVWLHDAACALLGSGAAEGVVRAEYRGVPCQIRLDWFSREHGIVDLKTCDSLKWFEGDCKRFGYLFQMAFYRAVLREATGESVPVHLIAVEKNEDRKSVV